MEWIDLEKEVPNIGEIVLICDSFYEYYVCEYLGRSKSGKYRFQETIENYSEWTDVLWWCRIENPESVKANSNNLKPCPLCGCTDIREKRNHRGVRLFCSNCKLGFVHINSNTNLSYEEQLASLAIYETMWNDRGN